jgi:DNA repair protein RadD
MCIRDSTCSTGDLIAEGLLAPIRYYAPTKPDLDGIRTRAGDFALDQLAEAVDRPSIIGDAVAHYRKYAHGRRAVAFCVNIKHAEHTAAAFTEAGYRAVAISGNSTREERRQALTGLRQGTIDIVCNCALWVAGVDCPEIGCVILLRPTKSLTMYLQSVGRGLRTCAGKPDLIVLDHASCVFTHGLPQDPREWTLDAKPKRANANAPAVRECPSCFACHAPAPVCPCCGHVYVRETVPQGPQQLAGELVEVDEAAIRRERNREQAAAQTLEQLIEIGRKRGMKSPHGWAKHVLAARQRKRAA